MLVEVLDHYDRGVDHGPERDRDPAQAHDVGRKTQELHDENSHEDPYGKGHDGYEGAAGVEEEHHRDECHDQ
jgi:hypothetical protein